VRETESAYKVCLQQLFDNWQILRNELSVLCWQKRFHVLEPVHQTLQLTRHCSCRFQIVLNLLALLFCQVLDLGPARLDSRLPVAKCAACVWMCSAHDVGTQTPTVLQRLMLGGQLTVKQLQKHTVTRQWSTAADKQYTVLSRLSLYLSKSTSNPWNYYSSILYRSNGLPNAKPTVRALIAWQRLQLNTMK